MAKTRKLVVEVLADASRLGKTLGRSPTRPTVSGSSSRGSGGTSASDSVRLLVLLVCSPLPP